MRSNPRAVVPRRVLAVLLLISILTSNALGYDRSSDRNSKARTAFVFISALAEAYSINHVDNPIPFLGLGHFFEGNWPRGFAHLSTQTSFWLIERYYRDRAGLRDTNAFPNRTTARLFFSNRARGFSSTQYKYEVYRDLANHSFYYARLIDAFSFYRSLHIKTRTKNHVPLNLEKTGSLLASPFKFRHLKSPWVFVPVTIAGVSTYLLSNNDLPLSKVNRINAFDRNLTPYRSTIYEGSTQAYRQVLVSAGEEMYFRGIIQSELTEHFGPHPALYVSSLLFGLWHIPNNGFATGVTATLGGVYFGHRYRASGYDVGHVIALHFWLNWVGKTVEFLRNPRNGRLVYTISWKM